MDNTLRVLAPVTGLFPAEALPTGLDFGDGGTPEQALGSVYFTEYEPFSTEAGIGLTLTIVIDGGLGIAVPGLPDTRLVVGAAPGGDVTKFRLTAFLDEEGFELRADDVRIALRLPLSLLRPAPPAGGGTAPPFA